MFESFLGRVLVEIAVRKTLKKKLSPARDADFCNSASVTPAAILNQKRNNNKPVGDQKGIRKQCTFRRYFCVVKKRKIGPQMGTPDGVQKDERRGQKSSRKSRVGPNHPTYRRASGRLF